MKLSDPRGPIHTQGYIVEGKDRYHGSQSIAYAAATQAGPRGYLHMEVERPHHC